LLFAGVEQCRILQMSRLIVDDSDLFGESFFVGASPTLNHLAVFEFGNPHSANFNLLTGGQDFSERTVVV